MTESQSNNIEYVRGQRDAYIAALSAFICQPFELAKERVKVLLGECEDLEFALERREATPITIFHSELL